MREIEDWRGHRVLAIPTGALAKPDPVIKAYLDAAWGLARDLGGTNFRRCRLCPMFQADAEGQCAHPLGVAWATLRDVSYGGCFARVIVAEEYIPLVKMRLGDLL